MPQSSFIWFVLIKEKKKIDLVACFSESSKPGFNQVGVKLYKCINRIIIEFYGFFCCFSDEIYCVSPGVNRLSLENCVCFYLWSSCTHNWLSLVTVYIPIGNEW